MGAGKTVDAWDAWTERMRASHGNGNGHGKSLEIEALRLMPTPVADNSCGLPSSGTDYASLANVAVSLLPTPRATRGGSHTETRDALLPTPSVADGMGGHLSRSGDRSHELLLPGVAKKLGEDMALLPTPRATDGTKGGPNQRGSSSWGDYAPAITRWEAVLGRPAPAPTEPNAKGGHRLSPRFVEFLMGVPEGWVCDVPGITRNQALKALGNGIVPQQCAAAFRAYLTDTTREAVA